ncbi:hypothetical protein Gferi_26365 [Geosporobacter ferrireducens]|uniref:Uncharacterized protein n=1 Tax=Geosporobacter ferrireducens TaxID=1424294 RepID=A0A1D8GP94_9FIRM|nr:hypothetical protein Gferi_26365 [Geosporobacter ferrireducens]MTI55186.1 hypothetical protein [Geosporobacter ferrireducens]
MSCFNCQNCKQGSPAYFCLEKNDFVINESQNSQALEDKIRGGWKKGSKNYEIHRRKLRKEIEV